MRAVIFDYGGVLTNPVKQSIEAWLAADGIDPASFSRTLKAWLSRDAADGTPIHRLETGELTDTEFDALFAAELATLDGRPVVEEGLLQRLFAGMRPDPAMFALGATPTRASASTHYLTRSSSPVRSACASLTPRSSSWRSSGSDFLPSRPCSSMMPSPTCWGRARSA
jgi:hypothetical protein